MTNRAVVLTGGGARGAYQAGVLKYIGENIPGAHFDTLVGSSSGAINVAGLASLEGDISVAGPKVAELWSQLEMKQVFRTDIFSLLKIAVRWIHDLSFGGFLGKPLAHSLVDTSPLKQLLESIYQADVVKAAIASGRLTNVAISATEVFSGSLVTFVQGQQQKSWHRARRRSELAEIDVNHIMASSAIPLLFPSVLINNRRYVDGCIRSSSPLGPALRLGAEKILAIGVRRYYMQETGNHFLQPIEAESRPSPAQLGSLILNSMFSEGLDADVEHLERLNSFVPNAQKGINKIRRVEALVIRPSDDLGQVAKNFVDRVPALVRFLLRGLGSERGDSSDILSYLLFEPTFLGTLIDLGYNDARLEDRRLREFFASPDSHEDPQKDVP